jgi:hypothetical protein
MILRDRELRQKLVAAMPLWYVQPPNTTTSAASRRDAKKGRLP